MLDNSDNLEETSYLVEDLPRQVCKWKTYSIKAPENLVNGTDSSEDGFFSGESKFSATDAVRRF